MRMLWLPLFFLFTLVACSNDSPAITKIEATIEHPDQTLFEKTGEKDDEDEVEMLLDFSLPNEDVIINLDVAPILKQYLSSFENRKYAINKMLLKPLSLPNNNSFYLLQFSCDSEVCSYLLLNQQGDGSSYLLADLAKFEQAFPSPDNNKLLFNFSRNSKGFEQRTNKITIIDLNTMETVQVQSEKSEYNFTEYQWPIEDITWENNDTLTVTIPDLLHPSKDLINKWSKQTEKQTKAIKVTLDD